VKFGDTNNIFVDNLSAITSSNRRLISGFHRALLKQSFLLTD